MRNRFFVQIAMGIFIVIECGIYTILWAFALNLKPELFQYYFTLVLAFMLPVMLEMTAWFERRLWRF